MLYALLAIYPFLHKKGMNKIMSQINYPLIVTINQLSQVFNYLIICKNCGPGVPYVQISIMLCLINKLLHCEEHSNLKYLALIKLFYFFFFFFCIKGPQFTSEATCIIHKRCVWIQTHLPTSQQLFVLDQQLALHTDAKLCMLDHLFILQNDRLTGFYLAEITQTSILANLTQKVLRNVLVKPMDELKCISAFLCMSVYTSVYCTVFFKNRSFSSLSPKEKQFHP